ncbi:MAG: hypothetical protein K8R88_03500 [Armatimonadetes bacterium]|nr:hypothetical protein [Armatimonadota bacterium]
MKKISERAAPDSRIRRIAVDQLREPRTPDHKKTKNSAKTLACDVTGANLSFTGVNFSFTDANLSFTGASFSFTDANLSITDGSCDVTGANLSFTDVSCE